MKKFIITIVSILVCITAFLTVFMNSNYYYSKKLIDAIKDENIIEVERIISKKPSCINTYPSITSKWWHSVMNWRIQYPLNEACCTDNIELIQLLIENGADVNCNDGLTPLSITYTGKKDNWYNISVLLIKSGADINYYTEYSGENLSILQDIIQTRSGADVSDYIPENIDEVVSAFNYAVENCNHDKIEWMRVLQHSVSNDRIEIVKFLLDGDFCDVNDNSLGITALMFAARDSTAEMVELLLDYGADKTIISSEGKTAYDYAVEHDSDNIVVELLR